MKARQVTQGHEKNCECFKFAKNNMNDLNPGNSRCTATFFVSSPLETAHQIAMVGKVTVDSSVIVLGLLLEAAACNV